MASPQRGNDRFCGQGAEFAIPIGGINRYADGGTMVHYRAFELLF
jgi:hypothetical protein